MRVLEGERGHLLRTSTIHNVYLSCAETNGCDSRVDGGVPRSHYDDARWHRCQRAGLVTGDEVERVGHACKLFSRDAQTMNSAESNAEKDSVVLLLEHSEAGGIDHRVEMKIDPKLRKHFYLPQPFDERK